DAEPTERRSVAMETIADTGTLKFKREVVKKRLSKRTIDALPVPAEVDGRPAQSWTYDLVTPRLAICCWSTSAKTWFWVGRLQNGRMIRFKLGEHPEVTPEQARKLAGKISAKVTEGIDPRQERWKARDELTLVELFERYLEQHAKRKKKTWKEDEATFNRYCGKLKNRALSAIAPNDVMTLHNSIGSGDHGKKYAANRTLSLLSKMFNHAIKFLKFDRPNPCSKFERFPEEERDRFLTADELRSFFRALEEETQLFRD